MPFIRGSWGDNLGEANNFTLVDLLQRPPTAGDAWLAPEDLVAPYRQCYVQAFDNAASHWGQIQLLQLQVTVCTLPNRADTDGDGLNDSEELNLGSDGFQTDPWKADTDGDTIPDFRGERLVPKRSRIRRKGTAYG